MGSFFSSGGEGFFYGLLYEINLIGVTQKFITYPNVVHVISNGIN